MTDKAKIMAVGMWTSAPPTKPGWYWKRRAWHENDRILTTEQGIVFVDQYLQLPGLGVIGTAEEYASRVGNVEWAGPIHDPDDALCAEEAGAQESVVADFEHWYIHERHELLHGYALAKQVWEGAAKFYSAPPSSQALIDAARYKWLKENFAEMHFVRAGNRLIVENGDAPEKLDVLVDALIEAKGG